MTVLLVPEFDIGFLFQLIWCYQVSGLHFNTNLSPQSVHQRDCTIEIGSERLWKVYCYVVHARNIQRETKKAPHSCVPKTQECGQVSQSTGSPQSPGFVTENTSEVGKKLKQLGGSAVI